MLLLLTLLACDYNIFPFDTADDSPSVFDGADYGMGGSTWPITFYAYMNDGTDVAAVELDWSYGDPASRERHPFTANPESRYNEWILEIQDEDTVNPPSCDTTECAVRIDALDASGALLGCITRGGERSWVEAEDCHAWISAF